MARNAVVGLKPDLDHSELVKLTTSVVEPGGTIHLVALVQIGKDEDELERLAEVKKQTEAVAAKLDEQGFEAGTVIEIATVGMGAELARIAERLAADLMVIGMAKRSRVGKALLGSDAQSALLRAPCPVLATRIP